MVLAEHHHIPLNLTHIRSRRISYHFVPDWICHPHAVDLSTVLLPSSGACNPSYTHAQDWSFFFSSKDLRAFGVWSRYSDREWCLWSNSLTVPPKITCDCRCISTRHDTGFRIVFILCTLCHPGLFEAYEVSTFPACVSMGELVTLRCSQRDFGRSRANCLIISANPRILVRLVIVFAALFGHVQVWVLCKYLSDAFDKTCACPPLVARAACCSDMAFRLQWGKDLTEWSTLIDSIYTLVQVPHRTFVISLLQNITVKRSF